MNFWPGSVRIRAFYLSGEDPRFYKRGIGQYPARLSGGFQSPTEINASGGSQPCAVEGAYAPRTSRQERRGVLEHLKKEGPEASSIRSAVFGMTFDPCMVTSALPQEGRLCPGLYLLPHLCYTDRGEIIITGEL